MLILELVRGSQTINLYYTRGNNLVIRRKARESIGLSGNESETSAEAQTLGEHLMVSGILNP